jgi:hypothetical protein
LSGARDQEDTPDKGVPAAAAAAAAAAADKAARAAVLGMGAHPAAG